eukprot:1298448-Rhodomonas_salina.1
MGPCAGKIGDMGRSEVCEDGGGGDQLQEKATKSALVGDPSRRAAKLLTPCAGPDAPLARTTGMQLTQQHCDGTVLFCGRYPCPSSRHMMAFPSTTVSESHINAPGHVPALARPSLVVKDQS